MLDSMSGLLGLMMHETPNDVVRDSVQLGDYCTCGHMLYDHALNYIESTDDVILGSCFKCKNCRKFKFSKKY